jgi:hypothetical protein
MQLASRLEGARAMNRGLYYFYESAHAMMAPARAMSDAVRLF